MTDHRHYTSKFPAPDDDRVIDVENWEKNDEIDPEKNGDFDANLIALIEFHPWIYDKKAQKTQDKESMEAGWLGIAQSLNSTGILFI